MVKLAIEQWLFLGESGRGKSTLAASFATSYFRFLTDDGQRLKPTSSDGNTYRALPSHPSIRLWADSQQALMELMKHSFLLDIEARDMLAAQFEHLSRVVNRSICFRLDYPRSFDGLPAIRDAIVAHTSNEDFFQ